MADWVLDASAALAMMRSEPGADRVAQAIADSVMSSVNAAEVVTRLVRDGVEAGIAGRLVVELRCSIVAVDAELGIRAGRLYQSTHPRGLSLGDRFCLALAERVSLPALTADQSWAELDLPIEVVLIR
jgi:PIN domain nuclease of toxin-antitoxin system